MTTARRQRAHHHLLPAIFLQSTTYYYYYYYYYYYCTAVVPISIKCTTLRSSQINGTITFLYYVYVALLLLEQTKKWIEKVSKGKQPQPAVRVVNPKSACAGDWFSWLLSVPVFFITLRLPGGRGEGVVN